MTHELQEHERFISYEDNRPCAKYDKLSIDDEGKLRAHPLIQWIYNPYDKEKRPGYYASFNIGAQWVDVEHTEAFVVTTKEKMENIDFIRMFMACFNSGIEIEEFNKVYEINIDEPPIEAPSLKSIISPLIVIHFLSVVGRIKSLKRGYIHCNENLKKMKGSINILRNEQQNIMPKRYNRIFCKYNDYSIDIPENRLIKRALLYAKKIVAEISKTNSNLDALRVLLAKDIAMFEHVSGDVEIREVKLIRSHKLYTEYKEAIRLAKLILHHFDYNISKVTTKEKVIPFVIDMPLLYEHYVLGLLKESYGDKIVYQYVGSKKEKPDFLFCSDDYKAILDTKYIPKFEERPIYLDVIRQLCGYGRDLKILRRLGYKNLDKSSSIAVPCIIIYPTEGKSATNIFLEKKPRDLFSAKVSDWYLLYKINVDLPTINRT